MQDKAIILPVEGIELISPLDERHGKRVLSSDSDHGYKMYLDREGELLNSSDNDLKIRMIGGLFGGEHRLRQRPPLDGYMPRTLDKPHRFAIAYDDAEHYNYLGTSDLYVKDYYPFRFDGSENYPVSREHNGRMISFKGELYYVCEYYYLSGVDNTNHVRLYKFDGEIFNLVKIFDIPVDSYEIGGDYQFGSPDMYELDGKLHVVFRTVDRNVNSNIIQIFESEDGVNWSFKTNFPFDPSNTVSYDEFRLRVAVGLDTIMIVTYGVRLIERSTGNDVEWHDMNSWVSFDGGFKFNSRQGKYSNIIVNDSGDSVISADTTFSMASMFIPDLEPEYLESDLTGFKPNFDLYYDSDMGSFVVIKPGDPNNTWDNGQYLMAIATTENDYFEWEPLFKFKIDISKNGDVEDPPFGDFNIRYETPSSENSHNYRLSDVCVVDGETRKTMFLSVTKVNSSVLSLPFPGGVAMTEFRIISDDDIPPGISQDLFAYGEKQHPKWSYVGSPINMDFGGPYGSGNHDGYDAPPKNMCAARHRSSIWYSDKYYNPDTTTYQRRCLINFGPWSNAGELHGYQFGWPRFIPHYTEIGFNPVTTGGSSINYNNTVAVLEADISANTEQAYMEIVSGHALPSIVDRAGISNSFFKVKFEYRFDSLSGTAKFLDVAVAGTASFGFSLEGTGAGVVQIRNQAGVLLGSFSTGSPTADLVEIMCGVNSDRNGDPVVFAWHRTRANLLWTFGGYFATSLENIPTSKCHIGLISGTTSGDFMYIGSCQFSSFGTGVRPMTTETKFDTFSNYEPIMNYIADDTGKDLPLNTAGVPVFNTTVTLYDGSVIDFSGFDYVQNEVHSWIYSRSRGANDVENIEDQFGGIPYVFTEKADGGSTLSLIFKKNSLNLFDTVCLMNFFGVTRFEITTGDYDGATWTNDQTQAFSFPYYKLEPSAVVGSRMMLDGQSFVEYELDAYNILLYNTSTGLYEQQWFVKFNRDDYIEVNSTLTAISANYEFHLFGHVGAFALNDTVAQNEVSHIRVDIDSPASATLRQIGPILFGNYIDFTDHIVTLDKVTSSISKTFESDLGFSHMERDSRKNLIEEYNLSMVLARHSNGESEYLRDILFNLYKQNKLFMYLEGSAGINQYYPCRFGTTMMCSPNSGAHALDLRANILVHQYYPNEIVKEFNEAPIISITVDNTEPIENESIQLTAVATDPEGDAVSLVWDFGDGSPTASATTVNKSYTDEGVYTVTLTATDARGAQSQTQITIYVNPSKIVAYTLVHNAGATPTSAVTYTGTLTARDLNNDPVNLDSSTQLVFVGDNTEYDLDGDASFGSGTDVIGRLVDGQITFDFRGLIPGAGSINIIDTHGIVFTQAFTFI